MSDEHREMRERSLRAHVRQRREAETKKHSTGPDDLGRTVDEGVEMLVGELHALVTGDTGLPMSQDGAAVGR